MKNLLPPKLYCPTIKVLKQLVYNNCAIALTYYNYYATPQLFTLYVKKLASMVWSGTLMCSIIYDNFDNVLITTWILSGFIHNYEIIL